MVRHSYREGGRPLQATNRQLKIDGWLHYFAQTVLRELETFFRNRGESTLSKLMRQGGNREHPETAKQAKFTYDRPGALSYINPQVHSAVAKRATLPHQFRQNCDRLAMLFGLSRCERDLVAFHILQCEFTALVVLPHMAKPRNRKEYFILMATTLGQPVSAISKTSASAASGTPPVS